MRRFVRICLLSFFFVLLTTSLLQTVKSFLKWRQAIAYQSLQNAKLEQLREQRDVLKNDLARLESDPLTQERLARKIGYIKPKEKVYRFVQKMP